jgi:hypothetical protein
MPAIDLGLGGGGQLGAPGRVCGDGGDVVSSTTIRPHWEVSAAPNLAMQVVAVPEGVASPVFLVVLQLPVRAIRLS